jgi:hypothetical protein
MRLYEARNPEVFDKIEKIVQNIIENLNLN